MKEKAFALISGGLDSFLAAALVQRQGVEVKGLHFLNGFETGARDISPPEEITGVSWLEVEVKDVSVEFSELIKDPEHGYGSSVNPCIDCRLFMLNKAREEIQKGRAEFLVTGEVLGQRPMTQNRQSMDLVEEKSGLKDLILRPLSAKLLPSTRPEKEGIVDREKLLNIEGRSRKKQLELAEELGLEEYQQPAGGCLLTDENFGRRMKELWEKKGKENVSFQEIMLLKYGRHFRLPDGSKAIIGRDEKDNEMIDSLSEGYEKIDLIGHPSPLGLLTPEASGEKIEITSKLIAGYSQAKSGEEVEILAAGLGGESRLKLEVPCGEEKELREEFII